MPWPITEFHIEWTTRDFINRVAPNFAGDVLDFGGGTQKYRSLIEGQSGVKNYKVFDCTPVQGVDFVGDAHATGLPDGSFDGVVCTQVLEHVQRPWEVVGEIARITRPGGWLALSVPFMIGYHPCPTDYFRFSVQGIESLCEKAYECRGLWTYGGVGQILDSSDEFSRSYNYKRFMKMETVPGKGLAQKIYKKMRQTAFWVAEKSGPQPSIYSNVGCWLVKK